MMTSLTDKAVCQIKCNNEENEEQKKNNKKKKITKKKKKHFICAKKRFNSAELHLHDVFIIDI